MQLDTINKLNEIVEREYNRISLSGAILQVADDLKLLAATLHELAMEQYLKEP